MTLRAKDRPDTLVHADYAFANIWSPALQSKDPPPPAEPLRFDAPLAVEAVRVNHVKASVRDESVSLPYEDAFTLGLRASDVGSPGKPATLDLELFSRSMLQAPRLQSEVRVCVRFPLVRLLKRWKNELCRSDHGRLLSRSSGRLPGVIPSTSVKTRMPSLGQSIEHINCQAAALAHEARNQRLRASDSLGDRVAA